MGEQIPQALPILVISGEADPVGQYGKGVRQVYQWLCRTGHEDVTLKLYPEHMRCKRRNRQQVYQDVLCWLNEKKKRRADKRLCKKKIEINIGAAVKRGNQRFRNRMV
ncbi:MAG: alpha/beta hydrolase [Christensenellales bacterium]